MCACLLMVRSAISTKSRNLVSACSSRPMKTTSARPLIQVRASGNVSLRHALVTTTTGTLSSASVHALCRIALRVSIFKLLACASASAQGLQLFCKAMELQSLNAPAIRSGTKPNADAKHVLIKAIANKESSSIRLLVRVPVSQLYVQPTRLLATHFANACWHINPFATKKLQPHRLHSPPAIAQRSVQKFGIPCLF